MKCILYERKIANSSENGIPALCSVSAERLSEAFHYVKAIGNLRKGTGYQARPWELQDKLSGWKLIRQNNQVTMQKPAGGRVPGLRQCKSVRHMDKNWKVPMEGYSKN